MPHSLDLEEIEHRARRSLWEHGLLEIFLGFYLLVWGIGYIVCSYTVPNLRFYVTSGLIFFPLLLIPLMYQIKKSLIYPRMGYAVIDAEAEKHPAKSYFKVLPGIIGVTFLLLLVMVGMLPVFQWFWGSEPGRQFWSIRFFPVYIGFLLSIGPLTQAAKFGNRRWYFFPVLFILSGIAVPYLGFKPLYETVAAQMIIIGAASTAIGFLAFVRFLRNHPLPPVEAAHEI